ncbi:unnamed protein product [Durusdinium trenchii]|uniref:SEC7 domain-containing protein n=2 Tax=Durusdinium trenchii TaxID=1381693 RepID=A0ABP0QD62_9DINO
MGNQALCGEKGIKCGEQCTQLTISQPLDSTVEEPEPAGAVFPDTLEGLNAIDRNLLLFSTSQNLAAVRWLLVLGANRRVTDQNGTTCLHAACRSGSCSIVEVLTFLDERGCPGEEKEVEDAKAGQEVRDEAGWTPLHVAAFMGRQDAVKVLLRNGANVQARTGKGQLAVELCSDVATRRLLQKEMRETNAFHPTDRIAGMELLEERTSRRVEGFEGLQSLQIEGHVLSRSCVPSPSREIRFEPFFVPRTPLIPDEEMELELVELCAYMGCQIFEAQPGRGLAFLVVSGCVRDYPIDLVGFIRTARLNPLQVGTFLGEDFSIAKILRMEFLNSVCLVDTGIVSALRTGLEGLQVPQDLQKMHRLLGGLSEVWWRQQLRAARSGALKKRKSGDKEELVAELSAPLAAAVDALQDELRGASLRAILPSINSLHQLFFSTVMLHWNLHAPALPASQKLSFESWMALNRSGSKEDVPEWLLENIYTTVAQAPIKELSLEPDEALRKPSLGRSHGLLVMAKAEGWAVVQGDGPGGVAKSNFLECIRMTGMISEATSARLSARAEDSQADTALWLSLRGPLLFFARESGPLKPFAFLHLTQWLTEVDPARSTFILQGSDRERVKKEDSPATRPTLQLIVLLPDGRFQAFEFAQLAFMVGDKDRLANWLEGLASLKELPDLGEDVPV